MRWKPVIQAAGVGLIIFASSSLLSASLAQDAGSDQIIIRAMPYSFLVITGVGIVSVRLWARYAVVLASSIGLFQEVIDLSSGFDAKDFTQLSIYLFFLLFFTWGKIGDEFT